MGKVKRIDPHSLYTHKTLGKYLVVASALHPYSLAVEYMKKWFLKIFYESLKDNFFKPESIYIDGSHIFNDFRRMTRNEYLKRENPCLSIIPRINDQYNRENIDLRMADLRSFLRRSNYEDSFFKDKNRDLYIGMSMEQIEVNFTFKVRVSSRPEQFDIYKFMKLAYRVGTTIGENRDMDFLVPYSMMLVVASDAGFVIEDGKINNLSGFLHYLNMNSSLPFLYKFRSVNGKGEFFIRLRDLYVHIRSDSIDRDDGVTNEHLTSNFGIEYNTILKFPAPQTFVYFTEKDHYKYDFDTPMDDSYTPIISIEITELPPVNDKGWNQYLFTEYVDEKDKILEIDFTPFFAEGELGEVVKYNNDLYKSCSNFIDVIIYNKQKQVKGKMDWSTFIFTSEEPVEDPKSYIGLYINTVYQNNVLVKLHCDNDNRISDRKEDNCNDDA